MKIAMRDSWGAYVTHAWGQDELMPLSATGTRAFCDTGASTQGTALTPLQDPALHHSAGRLSAHVATESCCHVIGKAPSGRGLHAGATLLDALDTLWIMDMKQEFARGRDWVAHNLTLDECAPQAFRLYHDSLHCLLLCHNLVA